MANSERFALVFYGKILPGYEPDAVAESLSALLKIPPEKTKRIMTGRRVVLKRSVDLLGAERYRKAFAKVGAVLDVENEAGNAIPIQSGARSNQGAPSHPVTESMPSSAAVSRNRSDEKPMIDGGVNSQRPHEGGRLRRQPLSLELEPIPSKDSPEQSVPKSIAETKAVEEKDIEEGDPSERENDEPLFEEPRSIWKRVFSWGFGGRIDRISYFLGTFIILSAGVLALLIAMKIFGFLGLLAIYPVMILSGLLWVRLGIQRCHDCGWAGWYMLAITLPRKLPYPFRLLSVVAWLVLQLMPGNPEENEHGLPPGKTLQKGTAFAASFAVLLLCSFIGYKAFNNFYHQVLSEVPPVENRQGDDAPQEGEAETDAETETESTQPASPDADANSSIPSAPQGG